MSPRGRILVVDDSRSTRARVATFLSEHGYEVVSLESGEEALERVERESFDLVLLDVIMKGIDGLDVLERIRERRTKLELPVLMATARVDSTDVIRALELGANDYVTKPFDMPVVQARIESQLALRRQVEAMRPEQVVLEPDGAVPIGTVLDGRYELLEVIGAGGFAVVYRARQVSTGQRVAVKVMNARRAAQGDVELARFRRETSLIAELSHPHIVRLVDSGWLRVTPSSVPKSARGDDDTITAATVGATRFMPPPGSPTSTVPKMSAVIEQRRIPFLVMEHIEGETLKERLRREGRLGVQDTVDVMLPVVSALWEAHSRGAIHRDLKPGNIMLSNAHDGTVKPVVLDFGVAKLVGETDADLTGDDGMIGTPGWWAPEQARGNVAVDERGDEYQLGAVMYACITGKKPFEGRGVSLVHEVASGVFPAPSLYVTDLPDGFEAVLLTMMATDPEDRYPTMRSVARALLPYATERVQNVWEHAFEKGRTRPPPRA